MEYSYVDPELKDKIKKLSFDYSDKPQPELLIKVPNPNPGVDYQLEITSPEVTSLCPLARTQPDFATVTIKYVPKEYIVELKSLKFYLTSFRTVSIFHEAVVGTILKDLVEVIKPVWMNITGDFTVRGGIHTKVQAWYPEN